MNLIEISAIKIAPNRQRRQFDAAALHELSDSITTRGLYHPIVLRVVGQDYQLVSGERRLRACTDIYALGGTFTHDGQAVLPGCIPYTTLGDLNDLDAEEAELEENIRRVDLSWQERASAHARLKTLRDRQASAAGAVPPSVADLSVEVRGSSEGVNQETTRRELIVARHLDDPEVAAAKNVDDAFKLLRRKEASAKDRALGEQVGRTFTAEAHKAYNVDALGWLASCPAEQFDVILTDPPYGMGADEFGDSGGRAQGAHGYEDTEDNFKKCILGLRDQAWRITKPQAHLYIFCDIDWFFYIRTMFGTKEYTNEGETWQVFRTPLIWYKRTAMRAPWPEYGPQRKYETILYAVKGKRPVNFLAGDVLDFPPDTNLGHNAQKPTALFEELLRRSAHPGDAVLDPFMGTGTIFPAAHALKCRATGIELDKASYGIAIRRLQLLRAQTKLPL